MTCTGKTWCDFKNIDTLTKRYFLISYGQFPASNVCPTLTYFNPVRFVTTEVNTSNIQIKIYPNPADDHISIDAQFQINAYEIIDNSGRVILKVDNYTGDRISTSQLSPGNYIIHMIGTNKTSTQKFLINR